MESDRKACLDSSRSSSFNYTSASPHSVETHQDLQKGISLLKKSVACVTAYCYNSLCLDVPSEVSTFEAFAKLLATLSSSKEVRSVISLKVACSRYLLRFPSLRYLNWASSSGSLFPQRLIKTEIFITPGWIWSHELNVKLKNKYWQI